MNYHDRIIDEIMFRKYAVNPWPGQAYDNHDNPISTDLARGFIILDIHGRDMDADIEETD